MNAAQKPPVVILARPQMGENIGAAARAMKNCALSDLRLVAPRDGWPNPAAEPMAASGKDIIHAARLYDSLAEACHDVDLLLATSARPRDLAKPVIGPRDGAEMILSHHEASAARQAAFLFGAERSGLDNDELSLADVVIQANLNPEGSSLNLAQAVMMMAWEWRAAMLQHNAVQEAFEAVSEDELASVQERDFFFSRLEGMLDEKGFFTSPEMAPVVKRNLRTFFTRGRPTTQELRTLHGVMSVLSRNPRDERD